MDQESRDLAQKCLQASYDGTMDFPTILRALSDAGFEGYEVDYRRNKACYFGQTGEYVEVDMPKTEGAIAAAFDGARVEQAVREAQAKVPGYSYAGFCSKVKAAGTAGYLVSIVGRRVVYFGRTAEMHVEHFPS